MSFFSRRLLYIVFVFLLTFSLVLATAAKLPEAALSFYSSSISASDKPKSDLVALSSSESNVFNRYAKSFICYTVRDVSGKSEAEIRNEATSLAKELERGSCYSQNSSRIGYVDFNKLINVIYTTENGVLIVGIGPLAKPPNPEPDQPQTATTVADGTVVNVPSTSELPPYSLTNKSSQGTSFNGSSLEVYIPDKNFTYTVENKVDNSTSRTVSVNSPGEDNPIPNGWQNFLRGASPKVVVFQPVKSILTSGSPNKADPVLVSRKTWNFGKLSPENVPVLGKSESGAIINSVNITHNLQFDQKNRGISVTVDSTVWNATGQIGSVNVYVKKPDGSYVKSRDPQYASQGQRVLVSGQSFKVPSANTNIKSRVNIPYTAFDLPSGSNKDLIIQTQVILPGSSANDEGYKLNLESSSTTIAANNPNPEPTNPTKLPQAEAYLINGYNGCCYPTTVEYVLKSAKGSDTGEYGFGFKGLGIDPHVGNWYDLYSRSELPNVSSDVEFRRQMYFKLRQGKPNVPVILIGHSFGADSLLKVAQCEAGNASSCPPSLNLFGFDTPPNPGRKILFLGIIDGVEFGGKRTKRTVPSNVTYLFNRWTDNPSREGPAVVGFALGGLPGALVGGAVGIPANHNDSGKLSCEAQQCYDQDIQGISRQWNGDPDTDPCNWAENCPGKSFRSNGRKQRRVDHVGLANDHRVQYQILEALTKLLADSPPIAPLTPLREINLNIDLQRMECIPDGFERINNAQASTGEKNYPEKLANLGSQSKIFEQHYEYAQTTPGSNYCSLELENINNSFVLYLPNSTVTGLSAPLGDKGRIVKRSQANYFFADETSRAGIDTFRLPRQRRERYIIGEYTIATEKNGTYQVPVFVTVK